jgi:ribonucleoside-diphosphate reductase alpha chain
VQQTFVVAHDISPERHVRMQAAFQKHTENAVSKTVNLPREASRQEVVRVFHLAYELGCKGVSVYRDTTRPGQVLGTVGPAEEVEKGEGAGRRERRMCNDCGRPLRKEGTCYTCPACGYSTC